MFKLLVSGKKIPEKNVYEYKAVNIQYIAISVVATVSILVVR